MYLKTKYNYIFINTAPTSVVADTLLINRFSDVFLYVIRIHYLPKKLLNVRKTLRDENKLSNMAIVLNRTNYRKGYGQDLKTTTIKEKTRNLLQV